MKFNQTSFCSPTFHASLSQLPAHETQLNLVQVLIFLSFAQAPHSERSPISFMRTLVGNGLFLSDFVFDSYSASDEKRFQCSQWEVIQWQIERLFDVTALIDIGRENIDCTSEVWRKEVRRKKKKLNFCELAECLLKWLVLVGWAVLAGCDVSWKSLRCCENTKNDFSCSQDESECHCRCTRCEFIRDFMELCHGCVDSRLVAAYFRASWVEVRLSHLLQTHRILAGSYTMSDLMSLENAAPWRKNQHEKSFHTETPLSTVQPH